MATLIVDRFSTACSCGYGAGGWADSPALKDPPMPILTPEMVGQKCPGCGEEFTERHDLYEVPS